MITARTLQDLGSTKHKVLLTKVPTNRGASDEADARSILKSNNVPTLNGRVRQYKAFDKAFISGVPVFQVKKDRNAKLAWADYKTAIKEAIDE